MPREAFPYKGPVTDLYNVVVPLASHSLMWTTERRTPQRLFGITLGTKAKDGRNLVFPDWLLARLPFKPPPPKRNEVEIIRENNVWLQVELEERDRPGGPKQRIVDGVLAQVNFYVNRYTKLEPTPGVEYQLIGNKNTDLTLVYRSYQRETTYHTEPGGGIDKIYQGPMSKIRGPYPASAKEARRIGAFLKTVTYID